MRSRRRAWTGAVVGILVLVAMSGAVTLPAHAAPQSASTHKLLIRSAGGGANYSLTVSGTVVSGPREQADRNTSTHVTGHVGKKDTVDAITYTGHITAFNTANPKLKATLDGTFLDASILDANHLRVTLPSHGKSQPVRYTIRVSKTIVSGEGVENRDSPTNTTTVTGWLLPGDHDGFYFRGKIVSSATSVNGAANVSVNGTSRSLGSSVRATPSAKASTQSAPTPQSSPTVTPHSSPSKRANQSAGHTLVIAQVNGSVGYTATLSGTITINQIESGDSIAGRTVTGRVGRLPWTNTSTDSRDVIHFTGELQNFEYNTNNGQIRVRLDGKQVDPNSLLNTPPHPPTTTNPSTPTVAKTTPSTPTATETSTPTASSPMPDAPTAPATAMPPTETSGTGLLRRVVIGLGLGIGIAGFGVVVVWRRFK